MIQYWINSSGYNIGWYWIFRKSWGWVPPTTYKAEFLLNNSILDTSGNSITATNNWVTFANTSYDWQDYSWAFNWGSVIKINTTSLNFTSPFFVEAEIKNNWYWNQVFVSTASHWTWSWFAWSWFNWYQLWMEANWLFNFSIWYNTWWVLAAKSSTLWANEQWHKLRWEWDWSMIHLYVDWILQASTIATSPPEYVNTSTNIGAREYTPWSFTEYTNGNIQKVRYWLL